MRLQVTDLYREFGSGKNIFVAVDKISFCLESGTILALLGPNGAGKTTTLQMLAGYLLPTSGSIVIEENHHTRRITAKDIGVVFGGELGFYAKATAYENLVFFAHLAKVKRSLLKAEIKRVLDVVRLTDVADKKVEEFSKGMRQRLHIARALLGSPPILLLDEPTNGIDVEIAHDLYQVIQNLAKEGTAILLTSHIMSEIEVIATRLILLGAGKIFHNGNIESVCKLAENQEKQQFTSLEEAYLTIVNSLKRV